MHAESMYQITVMQVKAADDKFLQKSHIQFVGGRIGISLLQSSHCPLILFMMSTTCNLQHSAAVGPT